MERSNDFIGVCSDNKTAVQSIRRTRGAAQLHHERGAGQRLWASGPQRRRENHPVQTAAGSAAVLGLDITENRREILRRTGSLIETPVFYEHLSATENLRLHLAYMGLPERRAEETLELVGLPHTGGQRVSAFSLGMRQRLAMARAIVHQPDLLILDEPANGLDPAGIRALRDLLIYLSRHKNMTILLSSHILSETEQTCDQVGILAGGMIQGEADPQDIARRCPGGLEEYFLQLTGRWSA